MSNMTDIINLNNRLRGILGRPPLPGSGPRPISSNVIAAASVADLAAAFENDQKRGGGYIAASLQRGASPQLSRILASVPAGVTLDEGALDRLLEQHGVTDPTRRIALKFEAAAHGLLVR